MITMKLCLSTSKKLYSKHEVVGSNPIRGNFLYGIEKPWLNMKTIYIGKFRYAPMITSKIQFETLVWQLMKNLARH